MYNSNNYNKTQNKFISNGIKPNEKRDFRTIPIEAIKASGALEYCEKTGLFFKYKKDGTQKVAGYVNNLGYRVIGFGGTSYYAHRLAWTWLNGAIPSGYMIDHNNWNKDWNVPSNLRLLTRSENILNQKLKDNRAYANIYEYKGKTKTTYRFSLIYNKERYNASFDTLEEAIEYRDITYRALGIEKLKFQTQQNLDQKETA